MSTPLSKLSWAFVYAALTKYRRAACFPSNFSKATLIASSFFSSCGSAEVEALGFPICGLGTE